MQEKTIRRKYRNQIKGCETQKTKGKMADIILTISTKTLNEND